MKKTNSFLDLLFPPRCALCDALLGKGETGCCPICRKKLPRIQKPVCMKCGKMIPYPEREYCEDCAGMSHVFDRGAAAFSYSGKMRQSVYRMKHNNRRDYLPFYAEQMADAVRPYLAAWKPQILIPVPMHPKKKLRRGFNQSELLAEAVGSILKIPIDSGLVSCVHAHREQKLLGRKERRKNLEGSFRAGRLPGYLKNVLIIDDVYTTGSTMDEMAHVLKKAGAARVYFLVLCTGKGKKAVCTAEKL